MNHGMKSSRADHSNSALRPFPARVALPRRFYARDPRVVAPQLLNKILRVADGRSGRIVEVEAYCGEADPAAHSYNGKTARNATMFGEGGHLYVYFSYGMHWCANAVGVLIRALQPLDGIEAMRQARPKARNDRNLCNGPGKLTQALGLDKRHDGADLVSGADGVGICSDGLKPPKHPLATPRVGISKARDELWRWLLPPLSE